MATTVGFVSEKGGVGKTTACYHIAVGLHWHHGKRVLVVDADYQRGGVSCRFLPELIEDFRNGQLPEVTLIQKFQQLYAGNPLTTDFEVRETQEGVDILPADPRLSTVTVDKMPASNNIRENNRRLWEHLSLLHHVLAPISGIYDYILIDSHPEVSDLLRTVIYACDYVVSPVKLDLQSTIGVPTAVQVVNEVNDDVIMLRNAQVEVQDHRPTVFAGAIGMMAREWGGILKATERAEYRRLNAAAGIFNNYVTEGDGLRQAAAARNAVYNISGTNAERQSEQFRAITREFMERCAP